MFKRIYVLWANDPAKAALAAFSVITSERYFVKAWERYEKRQEENSDVEIGWSYVDFPANTPATTIKSIKNLILIAIRNTIGFYAT